MTGLARQQVTRRARWLHPGAWWAWALCLAVAASRTTNPLLLGLLVATAAAVVAARRPDAPWARTFDFFLKLGLFVVVVRMVIQVLVGAAVGTTILLPLPGVALPSWMAGVRLGGDVMLESVLMAAYDGMRLATLLICVGAANSLASPSRLLKSIPTALYEVGVSVVIAMSFTPQLVADVSRVRQARHLRGRRTTGPRAIAGAAMPVFESALERSVALAAAMDSRGYGRRGRSTIGERRMSGALLLGGLVAAALGTYGLVAAGSPVALGLPMMVAGVVLAGLSLVLSGRTRTRSRYRPDPWQGAEWRVLLAGVGCAATFSLANAWWPAEMQTSYDPAAWPMLPLLPLVGIALALTPAWTAPPCPEQP